MLEFRQKRKVRRLIYSPITIVVLLVVVIVLAKATWNVHVKEAESRIYLDTAQAQLDTVSASQSALAAQVAGLETPEGVETNIRSQFLVAKPGEQVAVIVGGDSSSSDLSSATSSVFGTASGGGFWQRIADFFKF
jgi:cell division protein FtsB